MLQYSFIATSNKMEGFKHSIVCGLLILVIAPTSLGMFEAILTNFETTVKNSPLFNADDLKVKRFNRTTFVLSGSFDILVDYVADWDAECIVSRKMGNEYKLLPYKVGPTNACKLIIEETLFYPDIVANSENFPPIGTCDFKKGTYYIKDYLPNLSKVPPVFESGDYLVECKVSKDKEVFQKLKIYGQVYNIRDAKPKVG